MNLSRKVKEYRTKYKISLRDFGDMCNMSGQAISNIEKGISHPSGDNEETIIKILSQVPKVKLIKSSKANDLTGQRFDRLTVIGASIDRHNSGNVLWVCECECGNLSKIESRSLTSGGTKSCGCYRKERAKELGESMKGIPKSRGYK